MKKNISIISIAKDEEHIIKEWLMHNIDIGIDHIYIFDDQSETPIRSFISSLHKRYLRKITVLTIAHDFYEFDHFKQSQYYDESLYSSHKESKQRYFYNYLIQHYRSETEWFYCCDVDEFLYLRDTDCAKKFITDYQHVDIVYMNWIMFGTSYQVEQPFERVIDRFIYHSREYSPRGKSFFKSTVLSLDDVHQISNLSNYRKHIFELQPLYELPVHICHYMTLSFKTYLKRKLRKEVGYENGSMRPAIEIFSFVNMNNEIRDSMMKKYSSTYPEILTQQPNIPRLICSDELDEIAQSGSPLTHNTLVSIYNSDTLRYRPFHEVYPDFNVEIYRTHNPDLAGYNNYELYEHFIGAGRLERRIYS